MISPCSLAVWTTWWRSSSPTSTSPGASGESLLRDSPTRRPKPPGWSWHQPRRRKSPCWLWTLFRDSSCWRKGRWQYLSVINVTLDKRNWQVFNYNLYLQQYTYSSISLYLWTSFFAQFLIKLFMPKVYTWMQPYLNWKSLPSKESYRYYWAYHSAEIVLRNLNSFFFTADVNYCHKTAHLFSTDGFYCFGLTCFMDS